MKIKTSELIKLFADLEKAARRLAAAHTLIAQELFFNDADDDEMTPAYDEANAAKAEADEVFKRIDVIRKAGMLS